MECNSLVSAVAKTELETTTTSSTAAGSENCIFMFAAPFFGVWKAALENHAGSKLDFLPRWRKRKGPITSMPQRENS